MCKDLRKVLQYLNEKEQKLNMCVEINDDVGSKFENQSNTTMEEEGMRHALQAVHNDNPFHKHMTERFDVWILLC